MVFMQYKCYTSIKNQGIRKYFCGYMGKYPWK